MRIAAVLNDRCQNKKCNQECAKFCPLNRTGVECVTFGERGKPIISETLCQGCGICVNKCQFEAVKIIGLADELKEDLMHQYGLNSFRLYRLPVPKKGIVTGILGPNGIGKTTAIKMLCGIEVPNLGNYENPPTKEEVLASFAGTELHDYLENLYAGKIKTAMKPQYVDKLPKATQGVVRDLLSKVQERMTLEEAAETFELTEVLDRELSKLSGGELQRVAITLCLATDADIYLFDEPSAYLDSNQRMNAAKTIRRMMEKSGRSAMVVDHDIYFLDMVSDSMMVFGGEPGHHGIGDGPFDMREGMNRFLSAVDITFRRDADTHRPRINKPDSRLDREQKSKGEYYYASS